MRMAFKSMQRYVDAKNLCRRSIMHFTQHCMIAMWSAWRGQTQACCFSNIMHMKRIFTSTSMSASIGLCTYYCFLVR